MSAAAERIADHREDLRDLAATDLPASRIAEALLELDTEKAQ